MATVLRHDRRHAWRAVLLTLLVLILLTVVSVMSATRTGVISYSQSGSRTSAVIGPQYTCASRATCKHPRPTGRRGRAARGTGFLLPGVGVAVAVLALVAGLLLWKTRREGSAEEREAINEATTPRKVRLRPTNPREAVLAAFSDVEERLASHGVSREDWEPPESYLARAMPEAWRNGRMANNLARLYALARYSHHPVDAASAAQAIEASRGLIAVLDRASL